METPRNPKFLHFGSGSSKLLDTNQENANSTSGNVFFETQIIILEIWKRRAPNNRRDWPNQILKILNTGSISLKDMIWELQYFQLNYMRLVGQGKKIIQEARTEAQVGRGWGREVGLRYLA